MTSIDMNCYLGVDGQKLGPFSEQDVLWLYTKGKIKENTKFLRVGMTEWMPLSQSGIIPEASDAEDIPYKK